MIELHLSYANVSIKKKSCKEDLVGSGDLKSLKMIFILLAEVLAVYMQFTIIYIWHFSFKESFSLC